MQNVQKWLKNTFFFWGGGGGGQFKFFRGTAPGPLVNDQKPAGYAPQN